MPVALVLADAATDAVGWPVVLASISLIVAAIALSIVFRLGIERGIVWAAVRAAVQLLAVGVMFKVIFDSDWATTWAWVWTAGMVAMAAAVVVRRTDAPVPGLGAAAAAAVLLSTGVSVGTVFGFGMFPFEAVTLEKPEGAFRFTTGYTWRIKLRNSDEFRSLSGSLGLREDRGVAFGGDVEATGFVYRGFYLRGALGDAGLPDAPDDNGLVVGIGGRFGLGYEFFRNQTVALGVGLDYDLRFVPDERVPRHGALVGVRFVWY